MKRIFTPRPENFDELSTADLLELKRQWFHEANVWFADGTPSVACRITAVARAYGRDPVSIEQPGYRSKYGPKFRFVEGDVSVYVDDYGNYMTVHYRDQEVCSTHRTNQLFVPGAWVDQILAHYPAVAASEQLEKEDKADRERAKVASELTIK